MKILIAGDFCPRARGQEIIDNNDFEGKFDGIKSLISRFDYSIVNFETNISTADSKPIDKHGPNLTTNSRAIDFMKYLGFNVVTLANNHIYDFGQDACLNTIDILDRNKIRHVGAGENLQHAREILYIQKGTETTAVINACEHEFSVANSCHGGANPLNPIQMFHDIQEAKKKANHVLCIIHGGHEHFQLPSIRMQEWYRFFIDAGAEAVINHHQHCYSGMEIYNNCPIFYGLGNFFFDLPNQKHVTTWNEGIMVALDFSSHGTTYKIIPYTQCADSPTIDILEDDSNFNRSFQGLSETIEDKSALIEANNAFCMSGKRNVLEIFQPYVSRLAKSAYSRGFLPSFLNKKKTLAMRNMVECESHLDRLRTILQSNE